MKLLQNIAGVMTSALLALGCASGAKKVQQDQHAKMGDSIYNFKIGALDGSSQIDLSQFKGKYVLFVNVASKCGFTPQYEGLESLYEANKDNLVVIGFPCNQFGFQEPGDSAEIQSFCKLNYGVTFPLTEKIDVKGDNQHPIYQWLTSKQYNGVGDYKVNWNFNKFLVSPDGKLIGYFESKVKPNSEEITGLIK